MMVLQSVGFPGPECYCMSKVGTPWNTRGISLWALKLRIKFCCLASSEGNFQGLISVVYESSVKVNSLKAEPRAGNACLC